MSNILRSLWIHIERPALAHDSFKLEVRFLKINSPIFCDETLYQIKSEYGFTLLIILFKKKLQKIALLLTLNVWKSTVKHVCILLICALYEQIWFRK